MIVGVSGSRQPRTEAQWTWLRDRLAELRPDALHHGGCRGADEAAHETGLLMRRGGSGMRIVVHPASGAGDWTYQDALVECEGVIVLPPQPPLDRNHVIVDAIDILLLLPDGPERLRSGTWATFRYARKINKRIDVCYPKGYVVMY